MVTFCTLFRIPVPGITRVPWIPYEKNQLSKAMASFPPTVRSVMAEVLRPLQTYTLVDVYEKYDIENLFLYAYVK